MWIAGGLNGANGGAGPDAMAYSYNGTQWTGLGTTFFTVTWDAVYGDKWVAVGNNGISSKIAYSTNGTQWTLTAANLISPLAVAYGNSLYVAVGSGSNDIAWSSDGTSWTGVGTSIFIPGGGAGLGVAFFFAAAVSVKGTNVNGETRCLKSVIVSCIIIYYNALIIIHIHIFLCFYSRGCFRFLEEEKNSSCHPINAMQ